MKERKFGIYTSFYKCKEFIESAFNNIERINYENFEWHITDDFSNDGTKEAVMLRLNKSPIKHKIKYYEQTEKKEMYWAPNKFFDPSFDWIVLVDSDDTIDPNSLLIYDRNITEDAVLVSSDFHKKTTDRLNSISYIINDEPISSKIERYHPDVDYLTNLSYSCFGHLRAFKNLPNVEFVVDNINAGAEDSYHIFWCNSYGKYLHIPRPMYNWMLRGNSESHSGGFGEHFNDNFEGALSKLNASDYGVDKKFNSLYKETCALGSYAIGGLTNKQVSLYTRELVSDDIDILTDLYFDIGLKINSSAGQINIIVANYYTKAELENLLENIRGQGEILIYYQNDKRHLTSEEKDRELKKSLNILIDITGKYFLRHNYFSYIRHIIITANSWISR